MKKYIPYLLLSLPFCAMILLWKKIPTTVIIHTASSDQILDKSDFGGVVVAITVGIAFISYGLLQLESSFNPMTQKQLNKAHLITCSVASLLGLIVLCLGLTSH